MKNILIILFAVIITSCSEDFLNIAPKSSITSGNFYVTEAHFDQALVGAYASLRPAFGNPSSWTMGEMRSDNTHLEFNITNRGGTYVEREYADFFMDEAISNTVAEKYNTCYVAIGRVNLILELIPQSSLSQPAKDRIQGQASFLRGLLYFELVRYFGGVSLYLAPVKGVDDAYLPRATTIQVYQAIIGDLNLAIEKLSAPTFPQNGQANDGSARMLLANVYLTLKDYPKAEAELKQVTGMGYSLLNKYESLYQLNNKNSVESIFSVQYQQGNQGQQSSFLYNFLPLSSDVSLITKFPSANTQGGGWNTPTFEMMEAYEEGDLRLDASIGIVEGTGQIGNMFIEKFRSPVDFTATPGKRTYLFVKKFLTPHSLVQNTDDNLHIYRFAEALLSLAEVLNEQGKSAESLIYLNQVRVRAGLKPTTETNQNLLREIIAKERRVELAFENKRWLDLVRTGKAIEVMNLNGKYLKTFYAGSSYLPDISYKLTSDKLLFPIPLREIKVGKLEQNPGY